MRGPVRSHRMRMTLALVVIAAVVGGASLAHADGRITPVSVTPAGAVGNDRSFGCAVSSDRRYVLFSSDANDLVPGDTNGGSDAFVRDTVAGTTERVSVSSAEAQASGRSWAYAMSSDGRYVLFDSNASDVVAGDTNGVQDAFLRDRVLGTTERVSLGDVGQQIGSAMWGGGYAEDVSDDGRYVLFSCAATGVVSPEVGSAERTYLRDRVAGTTIRIGPQGSRCDMSADGRFIAFTAGAILPGDTNGVADVFLRDTVVGTTTLVSVRSDGVQGDQPSIEPRVTDDGRYVVFNSYASNLVPQGVYTGERNVYRKDMVSGETTLVSQRLDGGLALTDSLQSCVTTDGRYVGFDSAEAQIVAGDTNAANDAFVRDMVTGATARVGVSSSGSQLPQGSSGPPWLSADARYALFNASSADVLGAATDQWSVYLIDRAYVAPPPPPPPPPAPDPVPAPVVTLPKATLLTRPYSATYTRYYNRAFASYGYLKPRHTAGISSVALQAYHYEGGKWVRRATFSAKNANYSTYTKYYRTLALNRRGRWRIRAYHACSRHAPTYSTYSYFTVR